jgi:hypothetical protein
MLVMLRSCWAVLLVAHTSAGERPCPRGRANVLDFGADPTGTNDSAPAFRAAAAACQSLYAPAGVYTLRTPEPGNRTAPPPTAVATAAGSSGDTCPADGRNCAYNTTACTCRPGDGPPFDMAGGTKHPGCFACHRFLPPAAAFVAFGAASRGP